MAKRGTLVSGCLEGVSSDLLKQYARLLRQYAAGEVGVYALYKGDRLFYVGLARDLRQRLKQHQHDRLERRWDQFSFYIVRDSRHVGDIETLLLRIARPKGNRRPGKFAHCEDLMERVKADVDQEFAHQRGSLFPSDAARPGRQRGAGRIRTGEPELAQYVERMGQPRRIRLANKRRGVFWARVLPDGTVKVKGGARFKSPSSAGKTVLGRETCAGWDEWRYEKLPGDWRPLTDLRRG